MFNINKNQTKKINIRDRLKEQRAYNEQSSEQEESGESKVIDLKETIELPNGASVKLPYGTQYETLDHPGYCEASFDVYNGGKKQWPEDALKESQPTAAYSENVTSVTQDIPDGQIRVAAEEPVDEKQQLLNENTAVANVLSKVQKKFSQRILKEKDLPEFREELRIAIDDSLKDEGVLVNEYRRPAVTSRIYDLIIGYGPLQSLIDKGYNEIMVSRFDKIYVEEGGKMVPSGLRFGSEAELQTLIHNITGRIGKTISISNPIVDGYLPDDGSRFNAVLKPIAADGATLTIRRFPEHKLTGDDYLRFGSLDQRILDFLKLAVEAKWTTICSGGTGSGKTSLLNLMSNFLTYDPGLSVVTIEDSLELRLSHPNVRREETRRSDAKDKQGEVTARTLVKNALRQRPDVIVIGEIRDGTMADFLRAAGSGHDGCLTTIHANSPQELESQVIVLFMMADDYNLDPDTIRRLYATSVDLVVQIKRYPDHVRRISQISHIVGYGDLAAEELGIPEGSPQYSTNRVYVRDIFRWRKTGQHEVTTGEGEYKETKTVFDGVFEPTGYIPRGLIEKAANNGVNVDLSIFNK